MLLGLAIAAPAAATIIDTTAIDRGNQFPFGLPNSATYGQTFLVPTGDGTMTGFSLFLRGRFAGSGPLNLRGYVASWDGEKAGTLLYSSDVRTKDASAALAEFIFTTSIPVIAGSRYVAFLSVSDAGTQVGTNSRFRSPFTDDVIDGAFVFLNNGTDFSAIFRDAWSQVGQEDLFFRAQFDAAPTSSVPEPATWALMVGGLGMVGGAARRRRLGGTAPIR